MNIAIVSPWAISAASVGGTERFTIDLATQLSALGDKVEVFTLSGGSGYIQGVKYTSLDILGAEKAADEYDLQAFAGNSKGEPFYRKWSDCLESAIDVSKFDVIHLNSLLFIDAWVGRPRIFTIHTNPFEYNLDWGRERFDCAVQKIHTTLPRTTLLTAPSAYYSKQFSRIFNRSVLAVPHSINVARLASVSPTRKNSDQDITGKIKVLLPSRLELVQKRPHVAFQGVALLPQHLRNQVTIIATGKDPQYENSCNRLQQIADRSGFNAIFMRFDTMAEAYASADIVALPSKSESFGYSALESLALGIPTVLNNIPTFKEIGAGNGCAYFFDRTAPAFSQALLRLLINQPRRHKPKEEWLRRYDASLWARKYHKLAEEVAGNE